MVYVKRFTLMIQFLTSIPIPFNIECNEEDYGKGLVFAPLIGVLLGAVLLIFYLLLKHLFPLSVLNVIVFTTYIVLTGGLHLDGLGDTFDGLYSNRPKERILEIMRDSRVGTNAVLAIVCIVLLNIALLNGLSETLITKVVLLLPASGRIGSLVGAGSSKYARSSEGLGKSFINYCGVREVIIGSIIHLAIFYIVFGNYGFLLGGFLILSAFITVKYFSRKIGGATGDILGAVCELNQTIFLMLMYIFIKVL